MMFLLGNWYFSEREKKMYIYIYINLISFVQRKTCNARQENSLGKNMEKKMMKRKCGQEMLQDRD